MKEVFNEKDFAEAIQDKERFITLASHIGLTGAFKSAQVSWCMQRDAATPHTHAPCRGLQRAGLLRCGLATRRGDTSLLAAL